MIKKNRIRRLPVVKHILVPIDTSIRRSESFLISFSELTQNLREISDSKTFTCKDIVNEFKRFNILIKKRYR